MNNKFHVLDHPMLVYAGHVTTGHTKDLQPGIIGVFDAKSGNAVAPATINANVPVRFAQGSYHKKDALGTFFTGLKKSLKTVDFLPKDVMHVEYSPFRNSQNEKWIFGFDGVSTTETLKFECGKTHKFRVRVYGEGVYNLFTKQILRDVSVTTACCDSDECSDGCPDNTVNCNKYTQELVKAINKDVEISKFVRAEVVYPNIVTKTPGYKTRRLSICDNGDQEAQNAVQRTYPTLHITRISREGSISTYETNCLLNSNAAGLTSDYIPTTDVLLSVCNECASGYTLVGAQDVYTIIRNQTDFSTTADVIADYSALDIATIPTTDVNTTTNVITEVAHNFVTGQRVVYSNGAGTTLAGLTTAHTYYVIKLTADTFSVATTAALAFAGTAIDLTGTGNNAQTFRPTYDVTVLQTTPTEVILQLVTEEGVSLTAVTDNGVDTLIKNSTRPAKCTATTPTAVSWVDGLNKNVATRTMTMTVGKTCGDANRLAELQAYYVDNTTVTSVALTTVGVCEDGYTITQTSDCFGEDGCLTEELPTFQAIPTFDGNMWENAVIANTTTTDLATAGKCGIRLEVSSNYTKFDECSFIPEDYYTYKPTFMEIWEVEENGAPCKAQVKARKIQNAIQKNQDGEWARREYINLAAYLYQAAFDNDARLRTILEQDLAYIIDRNAFYNVYYIKYKQYRGNNMMGNMQNAEVYEIPIIVKDGIDTAGFETYLNSMFASWGVVVKPRTDQPNY